MVHAERQTEDYWESCFGLWVMLDMSSRISHLGLFALLYDTPTGSLGCFLGSFGEGGTTDVHIVVCVVC